MGITVAEPCFDSENESSAKLCAEGSERFEHLLLRPETDPQTDCSADVSVAPRHSFFLLFIPLTRVNGGLSTDQAPSPREPSHSQATRGMREPLDIHVELLLTCLLYTSDAADDTPCVDLGGRRIIKKKRVIRLKWSVC